LQVEAADSGKFVELGREPGGGAGWDEGSGGFQGAGEFESAQDILESPGVIGWKIEMVSLLAHLAKLEQAGYPVIGPVITRVEGCRHQSDRQRRFPEFSQSGHLLATHVVAGRLREQFVHIPIGDHHFDEVFLELERHRRCRIFRADHVLAQFIHLWGIGGASIQTAITHHIAVLRPRHRTMEVLSAVFLDELIRQVVGIEGIAVAVQRVEALSHPPGILGRHPADRELLVGHDLANIPPELVKGFRSIHGCSFLSISNLHHHRTGRVAGRTPGEQAITTAEQDQFLDEFNNQAHPRRSLRVAPDQG